MTRIVTAIVALAAFALLVPAAEKKVQMKDLPPAVQKTVQDETKGATIKTLIQETENGKTVYEVESMVSGKTRDFIVDSNGKMLEVEEQVSIDSIPAAAKAFIQKAAAGGTVKSVELLTKDGTTSYEASYIKPKSRKVLSITVKADGSEVK